MILEIRFDTNQLICHAVPLQLQLMANQQGLKLTVDEYFLCGGITYAKDYMPKKAYILNIRTMEVR